MGLGVRLRGLYALGIRCMAWRSYSGSQSAARYVLGRAYDERISQLVQGRTSEK